MFTDEFVLLIEVKFLTNEYKNTFGFIDNIPSDNKKLYVTAEKVKIDDYVFVQSHYETECKVVFVVGEGDNIQFYWQTLDVLMGKIIAEGKPYGRKTPMCYLWKIADLHNNLHGLI